MLNRVVLMGRLVRDPELRRTQNGVAVTSVRIAVERNFKQADGTRQTDFFDVVAWRNTAEFVSKYFTKGRMAIVEGQLQAREYTDRDGNKRTAVEVVADSFFFGDSKRDSSEGGGGYPAPSYGAPQQSYGGSPPSYAAPQQPYGGSQQPYGGTPPYGGGASQPPYSTPAPSYGSQTDSYGAPGGGFNEIEDNGELPF